MRRWSRWSLCRGRGRGPLDEAAALLLVDMLHKYGIGARGGVVGRNLDHNVRELNCIGIQPTVCPRYLEPGTFKNARYQVRRLAQRTSACR